MQTAIIHIRSYYGVVDDDASTVSVHDTADVAKVKMDSLNDETYCLDHNQASGHYLLAPVLDDDADYRNWIDDQNWSGCPCPDGETIPDDADNPHAMDADGLNCTWAEQQAISEGGSLALPGPHHGIIIVDMPAPAAS